MSAKTNLVRAGVLVAVLALAGAIAPSAGALPLVPPGPPRFVHFSYEDGALVGEVEAPPEWACEATVTTETLQTDADPLGSLYLTTIAVECEDPAFPAPAHGLAIPPRLADLKDLPSLPPPTNVCTAVQVDANVSATGGGFASAEATATCVLPPLPTDDTATVPGATAKCVVSWNADRDGNGADDCNGAMAGFGGRPTCTKKVAWGVGKNRIGTSGGAATCTFSIG